MLTLKIENRIIGIYCITNSHTGKIYVGSSNNIRKRIKYHKYQLRKNVHNNQYLQNAFNKYGESAFSASVLEFLPSDHSEEQICAAEQRWLDKLKPFGETGYNIEPIAGRFGVALETRKKLSDARIKSWQSPTPAMLEGIKKSTETQRSDGHFERLSAARKGKIRSDLDRTKLAKSISESEACKAVRAKIANSKRGTKRTEAERMKIKLGHKRNDCIQYDSNGKEIARFLSMRDMRVATGFAPCEVSKACKGIYECYPKSLGFKWCFLSDLV
jgi:group I intron endonuclease